MISTRIRRLTKENDVDSIWPSLLLSLFVVMAINLKLTYFVRPHSGWGFIYSLSKLVEPRSVIPLYEFIAFYALFSYVRRNVETWTFAYVLPALLFALFMIEGRYVETDNAVDFFEHEKFFVILCLLAFIGYALLHYASFLALDHLLGIWQVSWFQSDGSTSSSGLRGLYRRHPFVMTFCLLLLICAPAVYLNYPGAFTWDSLSQIEQALKTSTHHDFSGLDPQFFLYNKHPALHTLFIRLCLNVGRSVFHSDNIGLFCYTLTQVMIILCSISFACTILINDFRVKPSVVLLLLVAYVVHPRIFRYLVLVTKDGLYASFLLVFLCLGTRLLIKRGAVGRGYMVAWCVAGILTSLFRREGLYIIVPLLVCMAAYRGCRTKACLAAACIICAFQLWGSVVLPLMRVKSANSRVVFSVPFQQTVRYMIEYPDDLSDEERMTIAEVLKLEGITEDYKPHLADPILIRYRNDCTRDEMMAYLTVWARLFLRHPDSYAHAFISNKYQYFYPTKKGRGQYTTVSSVKIMRVINESAQAHFSVSRRSLEILKRLDRVSNGIFSWPIISFAAISYLYVLVIVFLFFYALRNRKRNLGVILVAAFIHLAIILAGPTNGYYFRYTYTLVMCLPVYLFSALPDAAPLLREVAKGQTETTEQADETPSMIDKPRHFTHPVDNA